MNTQELLDNKNIDYKLQGSDLIIRCLSPDHEDNNPSLRVDQLTGNFNCFSCGFGGNIFHFYDVTRNEMDVKVISIKQKIKEKNIEKLSIPLGAEPFNKSYRGISASTYDKFDAFTYTGDKDVEDRIIFPLYDIAGDIGSFTSRRLYSDVKPKYYNYPKNRKKGFFPPDPKTVMGSVILVEGIFDVLNLYDKGIKNAVSSLGLSQISKRDSGGAEMLEKYSLLKLQGINTIYIMYDGDDAGSEAANKLLPILKKMFIADIIELPDGLDPGDMSAEQVERLRIQLYEDSNN